MKITSENFAEFGKKLNALVKELDAEPNYGYIVEESVYSEAFNDSEDDYYEYEENCLISRHYSFYKDIPSILIEMDCIIEDGYLRFAFNHPSSFCDITGFSVYRDSIFISYTITDECKKTDDGYLEMEYHSFTVKKLKKDGAEALEPNWMKWNRFSFENIESLLSDADEFRIRAR